MNPEVLAKQDYISELISKGAVPYLVGGFVRDMLLGKGSKDIDIVICKIGLDDLTKTLKKFGRVNIVGKSFGVIKFSPNNNDDDTEIDFALPRTETSTGTGHQDFDVHFDPELPVESDLKRRDFTINAIAWNLKTEEFIDPHLGRDDIKAGLIRQVFDQTFAEDPLRLMRAVQFAARFQFKIEPETLQAMKANAHLINTVAAERIMEEIKKLFMAEKPSMGFDIMKETDLLGFLFPFVKKMVGIKQPKKKNEDVYQHTMKVLDASRGADELLKPGDLDLMLAALLHDVGKPDTHRIDPETKKVTFFGHHSASVDISRRWLKHFKATTIGAQPKKILNLVENHMFETKSFYSDRAIRRFINKVSPEEVMDLIDLRIADKKGGRYPESMKGILKFRKRIQEELDKKPAFGAKDLDIDGHDVMKLGYEAGPQIGQIMNFLVDKVLDEPAFNEKEKLIELINNEYHD